MAALTLFRDECRDDFLPARCMRCGLPTDEVKTRQFVWSHPALVALVLLGLIGVILMVVLRAVMAKRMTVDVPVCPRHRNHWAVSSAIVVIALVFDVALVVTFAVANKEIEQQLGGGAFFGMLLVLFLSIPLMIVASMRKVRPTKIDEEKIELAGVNAGFAEEVKALQAKEEEEFRARRKAKRDAEPICDDE